MNYHSINLAVASACLVLTAPAAGQVPVARSRDYMFATAVPDARALWVNPAALGGPPTASLLGEVSGSRAVGDGWRVGQYSIALGSRNAAIGYRRDRLPNGTAYGSWRLGGGFGMPRLSFGSSVEFHRGQRGWDVGTLFRPASSLAMGLVLRNISRPVWGDSALRLTGLASLALFPTPRAMIAVEARAIERRPASGYDGRYRAGGQIMFAGRSPVTIMTAFDFSSGTGGSRLDRWSVGLAFGGSAQLLGVVTALEPPTGERHVESFSLTGLSRVIMGGTRRSR